MSQSARRNFGSYCKNCILMTSDVARMLSQRKLKLIPPVIYPGCYCKNRSTVVFYGLFTVTNRFHFAVCLYSDNAQMTSKHGKNKEVD